MEFLIKFYLVSSEGMLQWNVTRVNSFLFPLPPEWNKQRLIVSGGKVGSVCRVVWPTARHMPEAHSEQWVSSNQKLRQREEQYHFLFWIGDCFEWGNGRIQLGTAVALWYYSFEPALHIHKYSPGTTAPCDLRSCHSHKLHPCMWNISFLISWQILGDTFSLWPPSSSLWAAIGSEGFCWSRRGRIGRRFKGLASPSDTAGK